MGTSIVLVPCTGRVEEALMLKAFENGADGVMVIGCLEGNCHYQTGNLRARRRVDRAAAILDSIGIGGQRLRMFNVSAGEGSKFTVLVGEMYQNLQRLGPSPINIARGGKNS